MILHEPINKTNTKDPENNIQSQTIIQNKHNKVGAACSPLDLFPFHGHIYSRYKYKYPTKKNVPNKVRKKVHKKVHFDDSKNQYSSYPTETSYST